MTAAPPPPTPLPALRALTATVAALAALSLTLAACGRPAPDEALGDPGTTAAVDTEGGPPDIAGVSITSPDPVLDPSADPSGPLTTAAGGGGEPQGTYTVVAGDTLWVIAARYDLSVEELAAANGITDVNDLSPGQELVIPAVTPVEVTLVDASEQAPGGS